MSEDGEEPNIIFYDPVTILRPIARLFGVNLDQVNFVTCLLASFFIGYWYRTGLKNSSRNTRAAITTVIGLSMCYLCYGRATIHLLINAYGSYILLQYVDPRSVHRVVFIFSMGYLTFIHIYRWLNQKSYCLDMTGSLMVAVGKITLLASAINDGMGRNEKDLNPGQANDALRQIPSFIDFTSYMFNFQTVIVGPMHHFSTWSSFLDGTHVPIDKKTGQPYDPMNTALYKFQTALCFLVVYFIFSPIWPMSLAADPEYNKLNIFHWWFWHSLSALIQRFPYYFAWIVSDSICNVSGFGFDGIDGDTLEAKWTKTTNVKPLNIEGARNMKEVVDNWNVWTAFWLRRTVYERVEGEYRVFAVYFISALWHGIAFGYYMAFLTCALFTVAAQQFRRCVRPYFISDPNHKLGYDIFGIIVTKFAAGYLHYPFQLMNFWPSLFVFNKLYYIPHIIAVLIYLVLPTVLPPKTSKPNVSSIRKAPSSERGSIRSQRDENNNENSTRTSVDFEHQLTMRRDV